jgi:uncharacterized protein with HEPN domain
MIEEIDEESWQIREVYAKYGLAMYSAQCFETGLVNLLISLKLKDREKIIRSDIDLFTEKYYEKTLGRLIHSLKQAMKISENLETELRELLDIRNYLAHRYFRVKAIDFMKKDGRQRMLFELESIISKLENGDKKIDSIDSVICEQYGITNEMVSKKIEDLLK